MRAPVVLHVMLLGAAALSAVGSHPVNNANDGKSHRLTSSPAQPAAKQQQQQQGSSFDQERLIALFGSEAQPIYGNRDPNTGRVVFDPAPMAGSRASGKPVPFNRRPADKSPPAAAVDEDDASDEADTVDRKDTRVPETNEVNPFELLPPQFHDLLNIPIHDYGNGTTYNPYDKFKGPAKTSNKFPLVSSGYANTKVQGSPVPAKPPKYRPQEEVPDYDYEPEYAARPTKPSRKPKPPTAPVTGLSSSSSTTESPDYYKVSDDKIRTTQRRTRPTSQPTYDHYERPASVTKRPASVKDTYQPPAPAPSISSGGSSSSSSSSSSNGDYYHPDNKPVSREPVKRPGSYDTEPFRAPARRPAPADDDAEFKPIQKPVTRPTPDERPVVYKASEDKEPLDTSFFTGVDSEDAYRPGFQDGDQVAEIRVTPKPFFAADENFNGFNGDGAAVKEHDALDIIYDYDDERNQGQGVLFMFDKEPSIAGQDKGSPSTPAPRPLAVTPSPVPSTYPTVAIREPKPQAGAAAPSFRPSAPIAPIRPDQPDTGFPSFRPDVPAQFQPPPPPPASSHRLPTSELNPPPVRHQQPVAPFHPAQHQPAQHQLPPPLQTGFVAPRPPFRPEPPKDRQPPPNILPLFRPNTQPTNEFQFIKHPQQINEHQRPNNQNFRNDEFQHRPRPSGGGGGMSPLPSAFQTPFSSISQAVANFFGRRSGQSFGSSRSGNLDPFVKADRSGAVADDDDDDLVMEESQPAPVVALTQDRPAAREVLAVQQAEEIEDQIAIESSPAVAQQVVAPPEGVLANPPPLGFKVSPDDASPPAFYIYTEKELEEGNPPYLVVGPVMSGPPKVDGAKLVHTAPVQSLPLPAEGAQRRSDVPTDFRGPVRPFNANALPTQPIPPPQQVAIPQGGGLVPPPPPPARKPFFPISGPGGPIIRLSNRPASPQNGLKPPPNQLAGAAPIGFVFPQNVPEELDVIPQGIAPVSPGLPPPRVPLNPQKDIASTFSNPTLLHNRPIEAPTPALSALQPLSRPLNSAPTGSVAVVGQGAHQQPLPEPTAPGAAASTPKPPKRKRPTKAPVASTTPALPAFNPQHTVTYSTIQQEDGKKIAVVHPAYIVTYKYKPGPPELIDLDAPFVPSVESSPQDTAAAEAVPSLEKWQVVPTTTEQPNEVTQSSKIVGTVKKGPSPAKEGFNLESGFLPFVPDEQ